jgi:hypothetical protein
VPLLLLRITVPAGPTVSEGVNPLARMRAASRQGSPEPQKPVYDDFGNIIRSTADNGRDNGFGNGSEETAAAGQPRVTSTGDLFSLAPEKMPRRSISSGFLLRSDSTNSLNGSRRSSTASTTTAAAATAINDAASDAVVAAAAAKVAAAVAPVKEPEAAITATTATTGVKDVPATQQSVVKPTATTAITETTDSAVSKDSSTTSSGSSGKAVAAAAPSPTSTSAASSAGTTPTSAAGATAAITGGASFGGKSWNRRRSDRDDNVTITYDQYGESLYSNIVS